MRNMSNREIDSILSRIKTLRGTSKLGNSIACDLIDSLCKYTSSVFEDNFKDANRTKLRENANSLEDYREKVEGIELTRKLSHDTLITNLKVADMLCRKRGIPEIYGELPKEFQDNVSGLMGNENRNNPGVVETRHAIADWAWGFMTGAVISLDIDISGMDYDKNAEDIQKMGETYSAPKAKRRLDQMTDPEI